jgi:DNA-binding LacI/PurR family transcriptional regulator
MLRRCTLKTPLTTTTAAVAKAAGVSIQAILPVINNKPGTPQAPPARVRPAIKDLAHQLSGPAST